MISRIYDNFRQQLTDDKVMCLNCGELNQAGLENCENCEHKLQQPRNLYINAFQTIVQPIRAMARIAATMPVMQAFLAVVASAAIYILLQTEFYLISLQYAVDHIGELWRNEQARTALLDPNYRPVPGIPEIAINLIVYLISWLFFSLALFYTARLFYRKDARINFKSLASVAGFARLVTLFTFIFFIPVGDFGYALRILFLVWQVVLVTIGVRFSTGLNYNRAILIAMIPTLLFQFIGLPI